jgi:hypothetical protein
MEATDQRTVDEATIACDHLIENKCYHHVNTPAACRETARMIFLTMTDTQLSTSDIARRVLFDMISMAECGGELGERVREVRHCYVQEIRPEKVMRIIKPIEGDTNDYALQRAYKMHERAIMAAVETEIPLYERVVHKYPKTTKASVGGVVSLGVLWGLYRLKFLL